LPADTLPAFMARMRQRAITALFVAAFLYGATFVVVKSAVEDIDPVAFVAWRFMIGAVALLVFAVPRGRSIWLHGATAGVALFAGYSLQTAGLETTTASKSALITGLYVVITPLLAAAFRRRAPSWWTVGAGAVSFVGLYLLTNPGALSMGRGDLLTLGCALSFSFHFIAVARYAHRHPVIPFTTVQLAVTSALAFALTLGVEGTVALPPRSVLPALAITGLGISAGAYLLQVWGQTKVDVGTAAIIVASESAFGVATGWVVLGERLDLAAWVGAIFIIASIYVVVTRPEDELSLETVSVTAAH
jgi:drug/metabolite transporter (DMT)-like permease